MTRLAKTLIGSTVLLLTFVVAGCNENRPDVAQDLIDAFASSCSSRGAWTDTALSHTNSLINVLNKIKTDGPCKALNENLSQIQTMNAQLTYLVNNPNYTAYSYNQELVQELTLASSDSTISPSTYAAISSALANAEAQSTLLSSGNGSSGDFANALSISGGAVQSLVQQAGDLSYCFKESPAAMLKLATNALAIGGSFISPVVGAGVATIGTMLNGVIDYIRFSTTNAALWKAYSTKMPLALTCGLEAMTRLYCQANDAFDLIEFQHEHYPKPGELPSRSWTGLDIVGRRLPVLTNWLLKVKTGAPPNDQNEAQKQIAIWQKVQGLDNADINVLGGLHGSIQLYSGATNDSDRQNIITNAIVNFALFAAPMCQPQQGCWTALSGLSTQTYYYACWLVDGYREVGKGTDPLCPAFSFQNDTIETYVRHNLLGHADIRKFEPNWKSIFMAAKTLADVEFSQTITLNPGELLRQAYSHGPDNVSPHEVFVMLRDYITSMLTTIDDTNPNDRPVMEQALQIVKDSLGIIENHPANNDPQARVRALIDILDLKHSARSFLQLVQEIVATDLQNQMDQGQLPLHLNDVLRSAGLDLRTKLTESGVDNLDSVVNDLNSSRNISENNITNFRTYFLPSISKAIKALYKSAHPKVGPPEPDKGVNRPNSQVLAKLCMLVITTGNNWPDKQTAAICKNQTLYSLYSNPSDPKDPLTVHLSALSKQVEGSSLQSRFCTYYKYMRSERLTEILDANKRKKP